MASTWVSQWLRSGFRSVNPNFQASPLKNLQRLLLGALLVLMVGCGKVEEVNHLEAGAAYNSAEEAMNSGDYAGSLEFWTAAIDSHSLNPDQYGDALTRRAECYGRTGDFAAAHADLDIAERGAPDVARIYATRSFVFSLEGKKKESAAAMSQAKKENSSIKPLKE